ncbi:hypothetical protein ABV409_12810 [Flagellimonas sp. DF-77]|uniref:hypothetical protein n=1 Tax=Flagellimonas algarum TaxID=3230298 RepID=UPI0033921325
MLTNNYRAFAIIIISCFSLNLIWAQKSAPVAGDAATLIDLLKKDYTTLDPENREQDLNRDRAIVISIFKSYLSNTSVIGSLADQTTLLDSIISAQTEIKTLENELNSLLLINSKTSSSSSTIKNNNNRINDIYLQISKLKKIISHNSYLIHTSELNIVENQYKDNDYLKYVLKAFKDKYEKLNKDQTDLLAEINYQSSIQKSIPFFGGDLAFETLIDGLSKFLAKRIKEELTNYVMENLKEQLENPKETSLLNELLVLMPKTTDYVKQFNADEILNFTNEFKQYIEKDFNNLLVNAANLKSTPRFKTLIDNNPDLNFAFEALELIPRLSKVKRPIDYFDMLENSKTLATWDDESANEPRKFNIVNFVKLATMLAHSMMVLDNNELRFASTDFMSNYGSEPEFMLLYLGFLSQQNLKYYNIKFQNQSNTVKSIDFKEFMTNGVTPDQLINGNAAIKSIQSSITAITNNAEKLYQEALEIKKASKEDGKKVDAEVAHNFVSSFIALLEEVLNSSDNFIRIGKNNELIDSSLSLDLKDKLFPFISVATSANNIVLDLHKKRYSSALITAIEIPANFTNKELSVTKILSLENTLSNSHDIKLLRELLNFKKSPSENESLKNLLSSIHISLLRQVQNPNFISKRELNNIISAVASIKAYVEGSNPTKKLFNVKIKALTNAIQNSNASILELAVPKENYRNKIESIINKKPAFLGYKATILKYYDSFHEATVNKVLLGKDDKYLEVKNDLERNLRSYLPELLENVFVIKDRNALKIIHFVNDLALSENGEDVEKALDAFALPTGSYSVKRKARQNVSVNSYPGILGGVDFSKFNNEKGSFGLGFTAPVGISINIASWDAWIQGLHLFVPIIDIAAPVRLRLDGENDTKALPELSFRNIFTPGVYLSFPIRKSPFAFNLGAQYGPQLSFEDNDSDGSPIANLSEDSFSINLGFVIDIPLFTIYNKPRKN